MDNFKDCEILQDFNYEVTDCGEYLECEGIKFYKKNEFPISHSYSNELQATQSNSINVVVTSKELLRQAYKTAQIEIVKEPLYQKLLGALVMSAIPFVLYSIGLVVTQSLALIQQAKTNSISNELLMLTESTGFTWNNALPILILTAIVFGSSSSLLIGYEIKRTIKKFKELKLKFNVRGV